MFQTWKVLPNSLLVHFHCYVSSAHQCIEKEEGERRWRWRRGQNGGGGDVLYACPGNEFALSWNYVDDQKKQDVTHNKFLFLALPRQLAYTLTLSYPLYTNGRSCPILFLSSSIVLYVDETGA